MRGNFEVAGFDEVTELTTDIFSDDSYHRGIDRVSGTDVWIRVQWQGLEGRAVEHGMREWHLLPLLGRHPGIVPVVRSGRFPNGACYVATPWRAGCLDHQVRESDGLDWSVACRIVARVADAVDYAHRLGIVHGELRACWLVAEEPTLDPNQLQLTAFGSARDGFLAQLGESREVSLPSARRPGNRPWRAPTFQSARTPQADLFGLGCLALQLYFGGDRVGTQGTGLEDAFTIFEAPRLAAAVLNRAVQPDAQLRQSSAAEFATQLRVALRADGIAIDDPPVAPVLPRVLPRPSWPTTRMRTSIRVEVPAPWQVRETIAAHSPCGTAELVVRHLSSIEPFSPQQAVSKLRSVTPLIGISGPGSPVPNPCNAGEWPNPAGTTPTVYERRVVDTNGPGGLEERTLWFGRPSECQIVTVEARSAEVADGAISAYLDDLAIATEVLPTVADPGSTPGFVPGPGSLTVTVPAGWFSVEEIVVGDPAGADRIHVTFATVVNATDLETADRQVAAGGPSRADYRARWVTERDSPAFGRVLLTAYDWQPELAAPRTTVRMVALTSRPLAMAGLDVLIGEAHSQTTEFERDAELIIAMLVSVSLGLDRPPVAGLAQRTPAVVRPPPTASSTPESTAPEGQAVRGFLDAALGAQCWSDRQDADELPSAMWADVVDADGEVDWLAVPSTVTTGDLEAVEADLGVALPTSYRALLLDRHFGDLDIWGVVMPGHLPGTWRQRLMNEAPKLRAGTLTVATIDLEEWDFRESAVVEVFFAWSNGLVHADAPVYVADGRSHGAYLAFSSGAAMFRCLGRLARMEVRPTLDRQGMDHFLGGDPEATDEIRLWWHAFTTAEGLAGLPPARYPAPTQLPPPEPRW